MKTLTRSNTSSALAACALALAVASPGVAAAQPNPFDAYDAQRRIAPEVTPSQEVADEEPAAPSGPTNAGRFEAGQWTVGGLAILQLSTSSDQQLGGDVTQDTTFFSRITPSVGYFVYERVEIVASVGALLRRNDRPDADAARSDLWLEASANYHWPVNARLALIPSVGLGVYFGQSTREFQLSDAEGQTRTITEQTSASGVTGALGAAVGYQLFDQLQLQMGLQATGLLGSEYVSSEDESLSSSSFHFGLGLGAKYFF